MADSSAVPMREALVSGNPLPDISLASPHHARDLNALDDEQLTTGQRVADAVARGIGSWRFIVIQSILLFGWIALNVIAFVRHWDPYPFILLNLALSFQAAYTAPIIMMSQNREAEKDRLKADEDFRVNCQAEAEIARVHEEIEHLASERWAALIEMQEEELRLLRALHNGLTAVSKK